MAEFGKIDILINNAGINIRSPIEQLTYEQFRQVQQVNVDGVWLTTRAVVPHMKRARYGRIINIASTLGVVGLEDRTPYTASKGAVVQLTRTLGLELAAFGICVNAICPGPFLTPMNVAIADDEHTKKFIVGRGGPGPLGPAGRNPGRRHLSGQRRRQLHDRQPGDRRRRLDGALTSRS